MLKKMKGKLLESILGKQLNITSHHTDNSRLSKAESTEEKSLLILKILLQATQLAVHCL